MSQAAAIGTNLNHPKVLTHQFGAHIRPKSASALVIGGKRGRGSNQHPVFLKQAKIPPRPYIGLGRGDEKAVEEALGGWLGD